MSRTMALFSQSCFLASCFWGLVISAAQAPDPTTIYAWFAADSGAITNEAGTVTNWQNQASSGNSADRHLDRFGGTPRLVKVPTSQPPNHVLRLSGGDNLYAVPGSFGSLPRSRTVAALLRLGSDAEGFCFDGASNTGMTRAQIRNGFWQVGIQPPPIANGANPDPPTLPASGGQWELHFFSFELLNPGTRITHSVWGGASFCYTNSCTNGSAALILGQSVSQSFGLAADLLEVLVYDRVPGAAEREGLALYLTNKWAGVLADATLPPLPPPPLVRVFVNGQNGYACYRIPAMVTTTRGTIIAVADGRITNCGDIPNRMDLVARRSFDNGRTWGPLQVIANYGSNSADTDTYPYYGIATPVPRIASGDAALLVDRTNGRVWVLYDNGGSAPGQPYNRAIKLEMRFSDDDGGTWSGPLNLESLNPGLRPNASEFLTGPGNGIQLMEGIHAGRLLFPVYVQSSPAYSSVIYSDDHGQIWEMGGNAGTGGGEIQICETPGGRLLATLRDAAFPGSGVRHFSRSADGGLTWGMPYSELTNPGSLPDPICQASLLHLSTTNTSNASRLVHANPAHASSRVNMTLRLSYDEGFCWPVSYQVHPGGSAYSELTTLATGDIGLLFEIDNYARIDFFRCSVSQLTDGLDSLPSYTVWAGEHFSPAQLSDPELSGPQSDADQDGLSNMEEFLAGTDPLNDASRLEMKLSHDENHALALEFAAVSNRSYTIQSGSNSDTWQTWADVPPRPTNWFLQLPVEITNTIQFFRLTIPHTP